MTGEGKRMSAMAQDELGAAERARLEAALEALGAEARRVPPSDALFERVMADAARVQAGFGPATGGGAGATGGAGLLRTAPRAAEGRARRAGRARPVSRPGRIGGRVAARFGMSPGLGAAALAASLVLGLFVGGFGGAAMARLAPEEATLIVADEFGLRVADAGEALFAGETPF
ncbi:MAG: hypothetical protein AAF371_16610 [Pseudomonadota bacterium]